MIVYVVIGFFDHESSDVLCVCATRELAEREVVINKAGIYRPDSYEITEFEIITE